MASDDIAISVRGLGKSYTIAHQKAGTRTLGEAIYARFRRPFEEREGHETFWALKDVDFDVRRGEVLGIIGRNGAGKSTLLKILSRITAPTTGTIDIYGRVASLLEVGTGFHPELTGRENIYLNGAILGMSRSEISRHFDEIVAFSEIEKFLDTPVKRYSSGMYVRLAFAVAAHLEPEILILDEVLAVGDSAFQKKCLNKMEDASAEGRTIIFVSHNMNTVTRLCPRAVLLKQGEVIADGLCDHVTRVYLRSDHGSMAYRSWPDPADAPGNQVARLRSVRVRDETNEAVEVVDIRKPVDIEMRFDVIEDGHVLVPNYHFYNESGHCVFIANDQNDPGWFRRPRPPGSYTSVMSIPGNFLSEGMHSIWAAVSTLNPVAVHFCVEDAVAFQVIDSHEGNSARGDYMGPIPGAVRPLFHWETRYEPEFSEIGVITADAIQDRVKASL